MPSPAARANCLHPVKELLVPEWLLPSGLNCFAMYTLPSQMDPCGARYRSAQNFAIPFTWIVVRLTQIVTMFAIASRPVPVVIRTICGT